MAATGDRPPRFAPPTISASELTRVAQRAFGVVTFEGGDVSQSGGDVHISPTPSGKIWARVTQVDMGSGSGSSSGSATDDPLVCDKRRYSFVQVYRVAGGCWAVLPNGITGDGINNVAYEANDATTRDGNVYELTPDMFWISNVNGPVQEWTFQSGGRGNGGGSGSGSGNVSDNSITIPECNPVTGERFITTLSFSEPVTISKVAIP